MKEARSSAIRVSVPLILLLATAILAPLFGGYVVTDETVLPHNFIEILRTAFGGSDAPVLTHALVALPALFALLVALCTHRVQQVPKQITTIIWIVFFLFLGASSLFSTMRGISLEMWLEWLSYGCGMFATIAICGRRLGIVLLMAAVSTGCFLVSLNGILEYGQRRADDPSTRIFAGWMNPNATAAILLLGVFASLGLCLSSKRAASLFAGIAGAFMLVAIALTGSKGAVSLALPLGFIAFGAFQCRPKNLILPCFALGAGLAAVVGVLFLKNIGWVGICLGSAFATLTVALANRDHVGAARFGGVIAVAAAFLVLLSVTTPVPKTAAPGPQATPMSRVSDGAQTQEQSSEFRLNLWKSAGFLIKERPLQGFGLGTYRNESARSGLTTATMLAHNIYLQIWSETGVIPILFFLAGIGVWVKMVGKGRTRLPAPQLPLLAGCFAAVSALLVHGLVDSDLYYFGIGVVFFLLFGAALSLAGDAVAPELIQKPVRAFGVATCCGICALFLLMSLADVQKGILRQDLAAHDGDAVRDDSDALGWATSFDGEARYLQALSSPRSQVADALQDSYRMLPSERVARMLANVLASSNKYTEAVGFLNDALERDPNNLRTLNLLAKIDLEKGDQQGAIEIAKKMVATEATPYFKVRSIPEDVPTETYDARLDLIAPSISNPSEKAQVLAEAVDGYDAYARTTVPMIRRNAKAQMQMPGFDSADEAKAKLQKAIAGGAEAIDIYRKVGGGDPAKLEADLKDLRDALATL
jgi:tetratricopeptide (TPR) repeat protein